MSPNAVTDASCAYLSLDPAIRFGKPCITGTRIAVADILGWLAAGMTPEAIVEDFPELRQEHIRAALAFAAHRKQVADCHTRQ